MAQVILSTGRRVGRLALAPQGSRPLLRPSPIIQAPQVKWLIRCTFYGFIFLLPFEQAVVAGGTTLPKLFGLALAAFALLQPRLCYKFPPRGFWWFVLYLFVFALWSFYLFLAPPDIPDFLETRCYTIYQARSVAGSFLDLLQFDDPGTGGQWNALGSYGGYGTSSRLSVGRHHKRCR